jgi:hypothetical protein
MKNSPFPPSFIKCILLFLFIFSVNSRICAQTEGNDLRPKSDFKSRLFFGGAFGLQFGSVTLIELSPLIGYKITPKFGIGIGPTYKYYRYKDYYSPSAYSQTNVFGGSIFARYFIFENVFAHAEYETLFYNTYVPGYPKEMQQYNSLLVGGGYRQQIGANAGMNIMLLWNLNDTPGSPYTNPVIRIGFSIGM